MPKTSKIKKKLSKVKSKTVKKLKTKALSKPKEINKGPIIAITYNIRVKK